MASTKDQSTCCPCFVLTFDDLGAGHTNQQNFLVPPDEDDAIFEPRETKQYRHFLPMITATGARPSRVAGPPSLSPFASPRPLRLTLGAFQSRAHPVWRRLFWRRSYTILERCISDPWSKDGRSWGRKSEREDSPWLKTRNRNIFSQRFLRCHGLHPVHARALSTRETDLS